MTRPTTAVLTTLLLALAASGCGKPADGKTAASAAAGRAPVAVETAKAAPVTFTESVEVVGSLVASREAEVKTEYSGIVAEVLVTQWVRVARGTPLARLDTREAVASAEAAKASMAQAEVAASRAARELDRTLKLKEAGLATQQGVDEARSVEEAAKAQVAAARAQLDVARTRLEKAVLRAPIDGVVAERSVNVGDYVENMGNPKPMFRIVDNRVLELTAAVPSTRLTQLRVGQPLLFTSDALPGREFRGKVSFINPAADETSRTVKVKAEIGNEPEVLKTGLFVKGRVVTGSRADVLTVPRAALQSWDTVTGQASVFVVAGGAVKRAQIRTGASSGDSVEVLDGLAAGTEVVTRGGFSLRDGDRVKTPAAGA